MEIIKQLSSAQQAYITSCNEKRRATSVLVQTESRQVEVNRDDQ